MTYCPLPFRHVFIEPRGIKPCCSFTEMQDMSVSEWLASERLRRLQDNILLGEVDSGCRDCVNNELKTGVSTRLGALKDYDGRRFDQTQIDYVDYRGSNICNFRCRSCEPYFSNGIAQDVRKSIFLQTVHQVPPEKTAQADDPGWIMQNLRNIRRLMFTGGEPTVIPEVRSIIQDILEDPTIETKLLITTNCSFTDRFWYDLVDKLPRDVNKKHTKENIIKMLKKYTKL